MTVTVREAVRADARAIAVVRVDTWRAAYEGLIDERLLAHLDVEREAKARHERWNEYTADVRTRQFVAEIGGRIVGWAAVGPCRDDEPEARERGEVYAVYALPAHWSAGVGHALMAAAEAFLRTAGFRRASLWVLDGNARAAGFYERHGWREDGVTKDDERIVGGTGVPALHERRRVRDLDERIAPA